MPELIKCPFCGGKAYELNKGVNGANIAAKTYCLSKYEDCPIAGLSMSTKDWNYRAQLEVAQNSTSCNTQRSAICPKCNGTGESSDLVRGDPVFIKCQFCRGLGETATV